MTDTIVDQFADMDIDQIRQILAARVDAQQQLRDAQTTVLIEEEGGRTFFEGVLSRTSNTVTTRSVGRAWDNIKFTAADGTEYLAKVWLTDVKAKAALPPAPRAKK